MSDPALSRLLAAAAAFLLRPPESAVLAALKEGAGLELDGEEARQNFYDVLCVPQSGRFLPSYAHVLGEGKLVKGGKEDWWHFPPPRYDGGDGLAPWYEAAGFDPLRLEIDPMLQGPHRPLDQAGVVLAYLSGLVASREAEEGENAAADGVLAAFLSEHAGDWLDLFCSLLKGSGSAYLEAVAAAVEEALVEARLRYGAASNRPVSEASLHA